MPGIYEYVSPGNWELWLQMELRLLTSRLQNKDILLDYLDGSNVIARVLKWGKRRQKNQNQRDGIV